jgi:hypothetical protein
MTEMGFPISPEPDCAECGDMLSVICPSCAGEGCDECDGIGEIPCPTCEGAEEHAHGLGDYLYEQKRDRMMDGDL